MTDPEYHTTGCLICGAELVYRDRLRSLSCALCGGEFPSHTACAREHFVCDRCHGLPATDLIERACLAATETDPLRLAESLMKHPAVKMHGPEHHYLVPAVLITAYCAMHASDRKADHLASARLRADDVKGGFCGFHGTCGAAMGAGIACSIITGATPLAREEWRLSNLMTAACLTAIGEAGGPRCCKRDTFLSLMTAVGFLNRHLGAGLTRGKHPVCSFSTDNRECREQDCRFYPVFRHGVPDGASA